MSEEEWRQMDLVARKQEAEATAAFRKDLLLALNNQAAAVTALATAMAPMLEEIKDAREVRRLLTKIMRA